MSQARPDVFSARFTQQEPLSAEAIAAAVAVLESGRLHRYNTLAEELSEAALLETEYAAWQGRQYCLACASGGYAMHIALLAAGLLRDDVVLSNAFTLSPVPGAILNAGGRVELVECTAELRIDLDDLCRRAARGHARFLLLSHMRGHIADMDTIVSLCDQYGLILIEDCAHTMGASWRNRKSGNYGRAACFSTQTYKHLNSGEGGLLVTDDAELAARAVLLSGAYMLYERHGAAPDASVFDTLRLDVPNYSGRMDNLRAAILRVQLQSLDHNIKRWNERYRIIEAALRQSPWLKLPQRPAEEQPVGSSIQFLFEYGDAREFVAACQALGVELKWFGNPVPMGFTANHHGWRYLESQSLPATDAVQAVLFDMRIPLSFTLEDCRHLASIIVHCAELLAQEGPA